jgi:hypothetical protein
MRLLKQRRAFTAFVMSTTPVMDRSIKSRFRVKYPTKKDRLRGAAKPPGVTKKLGVCKPRRMARRELLPPPFGQTVSRRLSRKQALGCETSPPKIFPRNTSVVNPRVDACGGSRTYAATSQPSEPHTLRAPSAPAAQLVDAGATSRQDVISPDVSRPFMYQPAPRYQADAPTAGCSDNSTHPRTSY